MAKKIPKVLVYTAIAAVALAGGWTAYLILRSSPPPLPTYFSYTSDELASLRELSSDRRIAAEHVVGHVELPIIDALTAGAPAIGGDVVLFAGDAECA